MYLKAVCTAAQVARPGLQVKLDSTGKGLYATRAFSKGDTVLREPPLCAIQHHDNRGHALVCGACFRFVGSLEEQLAWQLMRLASTLEPGMATPHDNDKIHTQYCTFADDPAVESMEGTAAALATQQATLPDSAPHNANLPSMVCRQTTSGGRMYLNPRQVPCPGGCDAEVYCSSDCAHTAWERYHHLLCAGMASARAHVSHGWPRQLGRCSAEQCQ